MANENRIRIGPAGDIQELPAFGRVFDEGETEGIRREERSASGRLEREILSRKKRFLLNYETADQDVIDRIAYLYGVIGELTIEINHIDKPVRSYQVLLQPYSQERLLAVWGGLWSGVTLEFLEV